MASKLRHFAKSFRSTLLLGVVLGVAGVVLAATPLGSWLEEEIGLAALFKLRGPIPAPAKVVVVSIDRASSRQLNLPNKPRKWPRALHADLVNKLAKHGAAAVAFDVIFEEVREVEDNRRFAEAMRNSNNVVLFQYLKKEAVAISGPKGLPQNEAYIETLVSPVAELGQAAFGLAPFPLPKVPARVNHFILFKPALGDIPTWPVAALQVYALPVYSQFRELIAAEAPDHVDALPISLEKIYQERAVQKLSQALRQVFNRDPQLGKRLSKQIQSNTQRFTPEQSDLLLTMINTYAHPHSAYLNFYGPPRSIITVPYHEVLSLDDTKPSFDFNGKAVFVGFSEEFQPEQKDGFYTVFTEDDSGLDVSGVEIGATAFANLLERKTLQITEPRMDLMILLGWGILLGFVLRILPGPALIPVTLVLMALYFGAAFYLFARDNLWVPVSVPLLWQAPLGLVIALLWKYLFVQRQRRNIRQAFGYHLPTEIVDQLADGVDHITAPGKKAYGIVMATDAEQYTRLSEQLEPEALRALMNRYYETVFTPIRNAGGIISDVVGDAAMAIWASAEPDAEQRRRACNAALQVRDAIDQFNQLNPETALPTRIGMHFGSVVMGHVGAVDHFEYRAVGDIVNTASRVEGLNKQIGTHILVSQEVIEGLDGIITREVGSFRLVGKKQPLQLFELVGSREHQTVESTTDYSMFDNALRAFREQRWYDALDGFSGFIARHGEDGPSRYYLRLNEQYRKRPPPQWDGVVKLERK